MPNRHRLILVQPEIPENIGFVVRAMSCFGWNDLALVGTQKPDPDSVAYRTATLGKDILDRCTVHADLRSAFGEARTTIAFTRRPHQKGLVDLPNLAQRTDLDAPWALVFGRESIGLTSEEVLQCDVACRIPTDHPTGSLNLGQAVAVALSGLHGTAPAIRDPPKGAALAILREDWVRQILANADSHLHPARQEAGRRHLAALLRRLRPTRSELRFLGGLLERMSRGKSGTKH
ncbi:MAG: RNA methyltransferase [Fibrobacteres bacterium]|nr:RNA methyltransferase [Fibrobacterota bacterium]